MIILEIIFLIYLPLLSIIFTFKTIFLSYSSYEKEKFSWELNNFFQKVHNIYLKKNYTFHIRNNSSALIRDINDVKFGIDFFKGLINLISEILIFIGIITLISLYNPLSTFIIFTLIGSIGLFFISLFNQKQKNGVNKDKNSKKKDFLIYN